MDNTFSRGTVIAATRAKAAGPSLISGLIGMMCAAPIAISIDVINERASNHAEKAVMNVGLCLTALFAGVVAFYLVKYRRRAQAHDLALLILASFAVTLVGIYYYWVSFYVRFPGDFLTWSESDFVNDILKFRVGYPLYSPQVNNESFTYVPGAQLVTYFLARVLGEGSSVATFRLIQLGYTLLASVVAFRCSRRLLDLTSGEELPHSSLKWWGAFLLPFLFLVATNPLTNSFTHNLHNDALAQLVTMAAYLILIEYAASGDKRLLILMMFVPSVGFLVKQNLLMWAVYYLCYLALFDRPRSWKRLALMAGGTVGCILIVIGGCYLIWGEPFIYWTFTVLSKHGVSPLRSFQHFLDLWIYVVIGLLGGFVLLSERKFGRLGGVWLIWLGLLLLQIYTSGVAWMLNHAGSGCLIAAVWFGAGAMRVSTNIWRESETNARQSGYQASWLRAGICATAVSLLLAGLGLVRIPVRSFAPEAYGYLHAIESEFDGHRADEVLLDMGTWVYQADGVVMKDRAPTIGERGYSQTGDFSGILARLRERRYAKILVRNLHAGDFWYDHESWGASSRVRETMLANYREVRRIPAVTSKLPGWIPTYGFEEISVLVPVTDDH